MAKRVVRINPSKLLDRMRDAEKNGSVAAEVFLTFALGGLQFSWNRVDDALVVSDAEAGRYLGMIEGKRFRPSKQCRQRDIRHIGMVLAHPREAAAVSGPITRKCACCGRPLTNLEDIPRGIGSTCWKKWGWEKT